MAAARPRPSARSGAAGETAGASADRRRTILAAIGAIVGIYLATRLALIGRLPWFIDEGSHGRFTRDFAGDLDQAFVSLTIAKEPLTVWIGAALTKLGFTPLAATRVVSLLAGLLTLAMVGLIARKLSGTGPALAAMGLYAVLPLFVVHDVVGIMDPLLTALMTSALYLQLELAERPRLWPALGLAAAMGLGMLTKEGAKATVVLLPLSLLCFDWNGPEVRRRLTRWAGFASLGLAGALAGWLLLRSSSLWERAEEIREVPILYPVRDLGDALADPWRWTKANWPVYRDTLTGYVTVPVAAAALAGFALALRERPRPALVLAGWFVALLAAALLLPISPYPRHALFCAPIALVFAGIALARAAAAIERRLGGTPLAATAAATSRGRLGRLTLAATAAGTPPRGSGRPVLARAAVAVAVLLVLALALVRDARILSDPATARYPGRDDVQYVTGVQAGSPWPGVADEIRRRTQPGEPVVRSRAVVYVPELLLEDRNPFVFATQPAARRARLLVRDELPFPDPAGDRLIAQGRFRLVAQLRRPRGGAVVRIYAR